jgi:hypothetical protein
VFLTAAAKKSRRPANNPLRNTLQKEAAISAPLKKHGDVVCSVKRVAG